MGGVLTEFMIQKGGNASIKNRRTGATLGTLYNREACLYYYDDGDGTLGYLASDGSFKEYVQANMGLLNLKLCTDYPYAVENINGVPYYIFKIRKASTVYNALGEVWGSVAAGMYVATTNAEMGQTHKTWKEINYVKSTSGQWVPINSAGKSHGYVPTGIETASGYQNISFYGSW